MSSFQLTFPSLPRVLLLPAYVLLFVLTIICPIPLRPPASSMHSIASTLSRATRATIPLTFVTLAVPRRLSATSIASTASPFTCPSHHVKSDSVAPPAACKPLMTMAPAAEDAATSPQVITGPAWTLEYNALDSPTLLNDIKTADELIASISEHSATVQPFVATARSITTSHDNFDKILAALVAMTTSKLQAVTLLRSVATEAGCVASVDGTDAVAKRMSADMSVKFSKLQQAYEPAALFLDLCDDDVLERFLSANEEIAAGEYILRHSRRLRQHKLSLDEENLETMLSVTGHSAWGTLYTDLSSTLKVRLPVDGGDSHGANGTANAATERVTGIATADAMRDSPDEGVRKTAYYAIRDAWLPHQETCAAALNAITGWRLDMYNKRGYPSFLTSTLHMNRMSQPTLDALLSAVEDNVEVGRRALQLQAKALGKGTLQPWDLFAPPPVEEGGDGGRLYTFDEGLDLIAEAVAEVDEEAGAFVRLMRENKWIEASRGDTKRPGAYCTNFAKSRTPRVYLSDYNGGAQLLLTLAHELGHAFHSWQMRDLPQAQLSYPMNLAETASIFFETVVGNKLLSNASSDTERFRMLWSDAESAGAFLLNLPARFRFEEDLNKRRANGTLSTNEIDDMMVAAWRRYYGDSLSDLEDVGVFSQSKLHFYITGISFYNWPYTFGYLFALGVYAEYQRGGHVSFAALYRELLRDTGRMDAEEVVRKHLGGSIDEAAFWKGAIAVAEGKIGELEKVMKALGKM